jgi:dephospho-CoA kinase
MSLVSPFNTLLHPYAPSGETAARTGKRPRSFARRIIDAIAASNQRRAEREVAHYIALNGGRLTDGIERQVAERLGPRG